MSASGRSTFESFAATGTDNRCELEFEGEVAMNGMFDMSDSLIDADLFSDDEEIGRRRADDVDVFDDELDDDYDDYDDELDDELDDDFEDDDDFDDELDDDDL